MSLPVLDFRPTADLSSRPVLRLHPVVAPAERIEIDALTREVRADGVPVDLTYLEFELFARLVAHSDRVHSREQILRTVWGFEPTGDGRTIDVHVARIRSKLGPALRDRLVTVRRVGYRYIPAG